jgi:RNA recognition motif-containing protein
MRLTSSLNEDFKVNMSKKKSIYVGNLPFNSKEEDVREAFGQFGEVSSVKIIVDRETGRPRGFCFVEMNESEADAAISALNGAMFQGRDLRVNEARERKPARY